MDNGQTLLPKGHSLLLYDRKRLEMDGVIDVLGFDGSAVDLKTTMGILAIEGEGLRIVSMSKETGKVLVEGTVDSMFYYKANVGTDKKSGVFSRKKGSR